MSIQTGQTILAQDVLDLVLTGWVPFTATLTRTGANTFTAPGDWTSIIGIGDMWMLTQTTVKKFYVVGASYSSPNTTYTVTGGSDYSLAAAAITSPYFSHVKSEWLNLTGPTWTTTGTAFTNQPTNIYQKLRLSHRKMEIHGYSQCNAVSGGTGIFIATFTSGQLATILQNAVGKVVNTLDHWSGSVYMETGTPLQVKMHKYDGNALGGNYATMLYEISAQI